VVCWDFSAEYRQVETNGEQEPKGRKRKVEKSNEEKPCGRTNRWKPIERNQPKRHYRDIDECSIPTIDFGNQHFGKIPIIGCGGFESVEDVVQGPQWQAQR